MAMASRVLGRRFALGRYGIVRSLAPAVARDSLPLARAAPLAVAASAKRSFGSKSSSSSSSGDSGLLKVLKSEIEHEKGDAPEDVKLKPPAPFVVEDKPGSQEVILRRTHNSEEIAVTCLFRITPYEDEPESEGKSDEDEDDEPETPVSQEEVQFNVTISKGNDGPVLEISCSCVQGDMEIEKVSYLESKSSKDDEMAYTGPDFLELDENLQKQFTKFLDARGINDELCNFLVNYMPEKERKEYVRWLEKVEKFVRK